MNWIPAAPTAARGGGRNTSESRYAHAQRIAEEELGRTFKLRGRGGGHNDIYDAERHARWIYRVAREIDVPTAQAVGSAYELRGTLRGQPLRELRMDLHNNAVGLSEFLNGRPIPTIKTRELMYIDGGVPHTYRTPGPR